MFLPILVDANKRAMLTQTFKKAKGRLTNFGYQEKQKSEQHLAARFLRVGIDVKIYGFLGGA